MRKVCASKLCKLLMGIKFFLLSTYIGPSCCCDCVVVIIKPYDKHETLQLTPLCLREGAGEEDGTGRSLPAHPVLALSPLPSHLVGTNPRRGNRLSRSWDVTQEYPLQMICKLSCWTEAIVKQRHIWPMILEDLLWPRPDWSLNQSDFAICEWSCRHYQRTTESRCPVTVDFPAQRVVSQWMAVFKDPRLRTQKWLLWDVFLVNYMCLFKLIG